MIHWQQSIQSNPIQKACLTVEENTRLKSRLQAAEAEVVQRHASSAEQDYEEVIQLLEAEIKDLKNQLASKGQARGGEATKVSLSIKVRLSQFTLFKKKKKQSNTETRDSRWISLDDAVAVGVFLLFFLVKSSRLVVLSHDTLTPQPASSVILALPSQRNYMELWVFFFFFIV